MGRSSNKIAIPTRSPIAINDSPTRGDLYVSDTYKLTSLNQTGLTYSVSTVSSTNTLTLLSLQGPGVCNLLEVLNSGADLGSTTKFVYTLDIDEQRLISATYTSGYGTAGYWKSCVLIGMVTYSSYHANFNPTPFKRSLVATIQGNAGGFRAGTISSWRLTRG